MKPDLSSSFFPLDRPLPVCYIITMEGEKFILYSNRSSNVHVFKYINPEGKEFDLDSREMPKGWDIPSEYKEESKSIIGTWNIDINKVIEEYRKTPEYKKVLYR